MSENNARIFRFIISIKNSLIPSGSSVESHPQDNDSQSRYTSEEHVEEAANPTKSLNLFPLVGQARSHSSTAAEEISLGQNSITAYPLLNELQDRFLQLKSRKPIARELQNIVPNPILLTGDELHDRYLNLPSSKPVARELQNIASEPLLPQKASINGPTSFILA
jgi:hypothetical protein